MKMRKSLLLRKYVIYNLCMALIPVLILASVYYMNTSQQAIQEFEQIHQYALTQLVDSINRQFNEFNTIAGLVANDNNLTPFAIRSSHYSQVQGIERIRMYLSRAEFLETLMLYYYHDNLLYSSNGVYSLETFSEFSYDFIGPWSYDEFYQMLYKQGGLATSGSQCFLRRKNADIGAKLLVLSSPCPPSGMAPYGTVIGLVNQNYFQSLLDGLRSDLDSTSFILDSDGDILFTTGDNPAISQRVIDDLIREENEAGPVCTRKRINRETYSVLIMKSSLNGWYYLTTIPHNQFFERFLTAQSPFLMLLVFLSFVCIITAIFIAVKNYRPIHKMTKALNVSKTSRLTDDELTSINSAIQDILKTNRNMQLQLDENKQIIIQNYLTHLINGYPKEKLLSIHKKLEQEGISLPGPFYCVMVLNLPDNKQGTTKIREHIEVAVQTNDQFAAYTVDSMYQNRITIILSLNEPDYGRKQLAEYISDIVYNHYRVKPQIGVGLAYKELTHISYSYFEAITACESLTGTSSYNIVYYEDIDKKQYTGKYWHPVKAQLRLYQALRQGNGRIVSESLEEIRQFLEQLHLPANSARLRYMASGIIIQLIPLIEEIDLAESDEMIDNLIHFYNIDNYISRLEEFCAKILDGFERKKQEEKDALFYRIVSYIDNNYHDHDISQKQIADHFNITPSFLSRFFRDKAGVNFIDYLTEKRMSRTCELLVNTNMKIREIMEQVGYVDLASFTRKFTKIFGISPGCYRDERRKNSVNVS